MNLGGYVNSLGQLAFHAVQNTAGFDLQSAPAVTGTFTNVPGGTSPHTNLITDISFMS